MDVETLKFITDENVDAELVAFLRHSEFDVFDIKEEGLFGMDDEAILNLSVKAERVVISQDSDFGTLIFKENRPFYGVFYLRPGHFDPIFHVRTFEAIMESKLDYNIPFILIEENKGNFVKLRLRNID